MLEASAVATAIPSLWSAVNSWFTPAVLFLLLNLMIATIALISSLTPSTPPSHDGIPPYPPHEEFQQQRRQEDDGEAAAKESPSISILDRVKSLGLFSSFPGKSSLLASPQKRQPTPLIPPEELYSETHDYPKGPYETQGPGQPGSPSPVGKFEAFDMYGYRPGEPTSEIPRESNPTHYIFEPTLPQEVLLLAERNGKVEVEEEEGEEEDVEEAEENEEEVMVEEETRVEDGSGEEKEVETETEVPGLVLRRGIRRSESLNVRFSLPNAREEEGRGGEGGGRHDEGGEVAESVEKRRPATVREGKGKWGGDEEVDARADDFINRFKQQLKLQRMDSLARQKDGTMISKVRSF